MSAVINDLRAKYPIAVIDIYTGSTNFQLVQLIPGINSITKLPITQPFKAIKMLKTVVMYDLFFDFGPWPRLNSIYSFFFNAKFKIGFKSKKQYRHYIYDLSINHSSDIHEINNYRALITPVCDSELNLPSLFFKGTEKSNSLIDSLGKFCIVHAWPGGYRSYMKEWKSSNWVALIAMLANDFDHVVITGAPVDIEKSELLFKNINEDVASDKIINIAGKFNLDETTHLLSRSSLIISVNTGIAHIAAAINKKQICLHGPTSVLRWSPFSEKTIAVIPDAGVFGYLNFGFEYNKSNENCMDNISVKSVYDAYRSLN
jgi:heptosyltransferase I